MMEDVAISADSLGTFEMFSVPLLRDVDQVSYDLSFWSVFWLIATAVFLYIGFYLIQKYVIDVIQSRKARISAKRYFPIVTSAFWLLYFIRVAYIFIKPYPLVGIVVVLIVLLGFWRFLKDFIAGLVFKVQNNYGMNQRVQLNANSGVINELLNTHVKLEADNGELIYIPYSEFANQIIRKPSTQERLKQFSFTLIKEKTDIEHVKHIALSCPWIISDQTPRVSYNELSKELTISGYTLDLNYIPKIKKYFE